MTEEQPLKTFGQLIGEHRMKHHPDLTQVELAELLHVSRQTIMRIENNKHRKTGYTTEFVGRVADVLNVVGNAREEFFAAAGLLPDSDDLSPAEQQTHDEIIAGFYTNYSSLPAYVYDRFYDLHSFNSYMMKLMQIPFEFLVQRFKQPFGNNILHLMFDARLQPSASVKERWLTIMKRHAFYLHLRTRKYIKTPRYQRLMNELFKFPEFPDIWNTIHESDFLPHVPIFATRIPSPEFQLDGAEFLEVRPSLPPHVSWVSDRIILIALSPSEEKSTELLRRVRRDVEFKVYRPHPASGIAEWQL